MMRVNAGRRSFTHPHDRAGGDLGWVQTVTACALVCVALLARPSLQTPLLFRGERVAVGAGSGRVFLVDVNRDKHLDLVASLWNEQVGVFLGNGAGRFTPAPGSPIALSEPFGALAVADINADGAVDLGIAYTDDASERVAVRLGDGLGRFDSTAGPPIVLGDAARFYKPFLRFADINEDGRLDVVAANERGSALQILIGDGLGRFAALGTAVHTAGYIYHSSELADVDRDGHLDLLHALRPATTGEPARFVVRRGDGRGNFAHPGGTQMAVSGDPAVAAVADVNADGWPDVVLTHQEHKALSVLLSDRGQFSQMAGSPLKLRMPAAAVVVADLNRDRVADLVVTTVNSTASTLESEIVVLLGTSTGRFLPGSGSPFPTGAGSFHLAAGDLNGDSMLDFAVSSFTGEPITLLFSQ